MKQKLFAVLKSRRAQVAVGTVALMSAGSSFAAAGDIDTSQALGYVAGGVVAAGAVTAAMFGLVALIGAAKKAMRAGT